MRNPVTEFRERLDLTRKELSILHDIKFTTLANTESGNVSMVPESVIAALRRAGIPWEELKDIQERYRVWLRDKVIADRQRRKDMGISLQDARRV